MLIVNFILIYQLSVSYTLSSRNVSKWTTGNITLSTIEHVISKRSSNHAARQIFSVTGTTTAPSNYLRSAASNGFQKTTLMAYTPESSLYFVSNNIYKTIPVPRASVSSSTIILKLGPINSFNNFMISDLFITSTHFVYKVIKESVSGSFAPWNISATVSSDAMITDLPKASVSPTKIGIVTSVTTVTKKVFHTVSKSDNKLKSTYQKRIQQNTLISMGDSLIQFNRSSSAMNVKSSHVESHIASYNAQPTSFKETPLLVSSITASASERDSHKIEYGVTRTVTTTSGVMQNIASHMLILSNTSIATGSKENRTSALNGPTILPSRVDNFVRSNTGYTMNSSYIIFVREIANTSLSTLETKSLTNKEIIPSTFGLKVTNNYSKSLTENNKITLHSIEIGISTLGLTHHVGQTVETSASVVMSFKNIGKIKTSFQNIVRKETTRNRRSILTASSSMSLVEEKEESGETINLLPIIAAGSVVVVVLAVVIFLIVRVKRKCYGEFIPEGSALAIATDDAWITKHVDQLPTIEDVPPPGKRRQPSRKPRIPNGIPEVGIK